jgi:IS6 family transposase
MVRRRNVGEGRRPLKLPVPRASTSPGRSSTSSPANAATAPLARALFTPALTPGPSPVEVTTDRAPLYPRVLDQFAPSARHDTARYPNNRVEADHARLTARLPPMRGLNTTRSLRTVVAGHAFGQNPRRGHHELTVDPPVHDRVQVAFTEPARCL